MVNIIDLQGKRILITGAASGIGRETAVITSRLGATVCLVDLSEMGLQETFSLLVGEGHEYKVMDLTDLSAIAPYIKSVTENNRLHGLVHCAGISSRKPLNVLTREGFAPVMDVNFYSFVEVVRQAEVSSSCHRFRAFAVLRLKPNIVFPKQRSTLLSAARHWNWQIAKSESIP